MTEHEDNPAQGSSIYGAYWDWYVRAWGEGHSRARGKNTLEGLEWPGDEWGKPEWWEALFRQLFEPAGVADWQRAVEIGPGSGKYTLRVLERSQAEVRAYDVSAGFLDVCRRRCQKQVDAGRLHLELLDTNDPAYMLSDLTESGWKRSVDGFFSIDAMVHVDLQYLIAYLLTAALALKPGGKLLMTVATATNEHGFQKLLEDIEHYWTAQGDPGGSAKYEFVSRDLIASILPRLGFELDFAADEGHRDLHFAASLRDPDRAEPLMRYLYPEMKRADG